MLSCDQANLKAIGLWNYFRKMPNTLRYLAREVYRNQQAALGYDPEPEECSEVLGIEISALDSFERVLRRQQNLRRSMYEPYAIKLAECALRHFWLYASAP